jgi:murein DD-endopeptidase MepM/ murein hydrolase activator NlpD
LRDRAISAVRLAGLTILVFGLSVPGESWAGSSGGASAPPPPTINRISCIPTAAGLCPPDGSLARGANVRVTGTALSRVRQLVFLGRRGSSDDATARPMRRSGRHLEARVPARAASGYVVAVSNTGRSRTHEHVRVMDPVPLGDRGQAKFYYDGSRKPSFNVHVSRAAQARVELVREANGALVKAWSFELVPGQEQAIKWEGDGSNGPQPPGRYRFRLAGDAVSAASATQDREAAFTFYDHIFPIRGKHNLGYSATNNFGGGRNHQGQDMFARCGTPIVAARGGTVQYAGYHSAAGYYVVIDGRDTGFDYGYMHMRRPPLVRTGQRVLTAQPIGEVGETGRAHGCHLHFEVWTAPGWYTGGRPIDPLPFVKAWDSYS